MSNFSREEDEEILVGALVKMMRASGESRKAWERKISWGEFDGMEYGEYCLRVIIKALEIAFRNEATA